MPLLRGTRLPRYPPPGENTLHCIGDTHYLPGGIGGQGYRHNHVTWDLQTGDVPDVPVHLQLGDNTDDGASASDAAALSAAASWPGQTLWVIGNHDVNLNNNTRTPAQWAAIYGTPNGSQNYTYDLPWARIIVVGFDSMSDGASWIRLSDSTLSWLDSQLTVAGSKRCYIACHASLYNTVKGLSPSTTAGFYVIGGSSTSVSGATSQQVLNVLDAHSNVAAWISGHTHSSIESPDIVTTVNTGSHTIAAIHTSCVYFTDGTINPWDRMCTPYMTDYGDKIEVRWRDHGQKQWCTPFGQPEKRVMTASGLTA